MKILAPTVTLFQSLHPSEALVRSHALPQVRLVTPRSRIAAYMTLPPSKQPPPHRTLEVRYRGKTIAEVILTEIAPQHTLVDIQSVVGQLADINHEAVEHVLRDFIDHLQRLANTKPLPPRPAPTDSIQDWFAYYAECKQRGRSITLKEIAREVNLSHSHVKALHARYAAEHKPLA